MLDTPENIHEVIEWLERMTKELGITEEEINSPEYDYMDDSIDIGKEPIAHTKAEGQALHEEIMKKYKSK